MRVDFVITELFIGGAERCLTELAIGLADAGDEVRVFSLGTLPTGQQRVLVDRLQAAGVAVDSAGVDSSLRFFRAYQRLRDWFRASKPDVVQSFLHHANVIAPFAAEASGIETRVGGLRVAESRPLRCYIERAAIARMQSVVCVSRAVQRFAARRLGCDCERSLVIPNGVDVARFASAAPFDWSALGWPRDSIVSLFVGRLHPQKGIELLQQQVDAIAPEGSNKRLLLVGDGPLRDGVQSWAESIGDQRVVRLPFQGDVAPLMRACRLLLLPSHYEGMPNVVLEAMAAGRPVVCSRVEGSDELLSQAFEQQSFDAGDAPAMARLVQALLSDESLCDRIGSDNQTRVRNHFSIAAMIDAYRSHYRMLLTRQLDGIEA